MSKAMWMVRAGRGGVYADEFVQNGYVGIGWRDAGDPTGIREKAILVERFRKVWPQSTEQSRFVGASVVFRFVTELCPGDEVITYDPATRTYHIGVIEGPAIWYDDPDDARSTQRRVRWTREVGRDTLSQNARNRLNSLVTLFLVPEVVAKEMRAVADGGAAVVGQLTDLPAAPSDPTGLGDLADAFEGVEDASVERIKDRIAKLNWEAMQDLVAALLRASGYKTTVSARGPDRGRDILATPDGFGFRPPRIIVEVKHRPGQSMGAPEVRAMPVGRQTDDRGLFVSTGGFTREAYYEAEHGKVPITLMTLDDLTRAIIDAYPQFDDAGRALLPLRRLYWPVA